jgi:hypothetical protein
MLTYFPYSSPYASSLLISLLFTAPHYIRSLTVALLLAAPAYIARRSSLSAPPCSFYYSLSFSHQRALYQPASAYTRTQAPHRAQYVLSDQRVLALGWMRASENGKRCVRATASPVGRYPRLVTWSEMTKKWSTSPMQRTNDSSSSIYHSTLQQVTAASSTSSIHAAYSRCLDRPHSEWQVTTNDEPQTTTTNGTTTNDEQPTNKQQRTTNERVEFAKRA